MPESDMFASTRKFPVAQNVWDLVENAADSWPDHCAVISEPDEQSLTFSELRSRAEQAAAWLHGMSVGLGDKVAVMLTNRIEYPTIWLACARLGAAMVPVNPNYQVLDAGHVIRHSGARIALTDSSRLELLEEICSLVATELSAVVDIDSASWAVDPTSLPEPPIGGETCLNVQYTSGTTGHPKGCLLSHTYWLTMAYKNVVEVPGLGPDDVLLTAQPFSYMDPQWNLVSGLAAGATVVILDRFHPSTFWQSIQTYGATFVYCLGVMPTLMMKYEPSPAERSHRLRLVACSGIPVGLHQKLEERYGVPWLETYGMTEIGNGAAMRIDDHDALVGSGAIGKATSRRELRIVDERDMPLARGAVGELVVRGVGLMDGYLNDPDATKEAFRNGWFHTGDRARMDENGYLYFVGRTKDMIRRSGENISAVEVEEAILAHPSVRLVACVPIPDETRGEEVKAFVVLADGHDHRQLLEHELPDHCSRLLSYFKVPRYWESREALPMTPSQKVARGELMRAASTSGSWDRVEGRWL